MPHILIVGVGSIGQRHVENFLKVDDVRCSIAEMDETIRQRVADQFPIEQTYGDFREADLPAFDGVAICTPTNTHIRFATEVASAGTHVLCEKPLDTSLDGVDGAVGGGLPGNGPHLPDRGRIGQDLRRDLAQLRQQRLGVDLL